jgi:eukaryotic-like serine/threonine-protein kinase
MNPERLEKIDEVFQSALDVAPERRGAFLDGACAGDPDLRREVESLLAAHEQAGDFIDGSASDVAAEILAGEQQPSAVGRTVGQYKIVSQLGTGGMGEVYVATDRMGRKVALKLLPSQLSRDQQSVGRFLQEARAVLALNHPNIITVYDIGQADTAYYIASELVEGETVRDRLSRAELSITEALDITVQVATALSAAHERGIIHRDIKPENVMLRHDGYVKVLDFGIAKLTERHTGANTPTEAPTKLRVETAQGVIIGTVAYMSPEQARGLAVDERTDIWSLGVLLYEMVAGRRPFEGKTPQDTITSILERVPPPISRYSREAPESLDWMVSKALRKDKGERYQTAKELLADLKELRRRLEYEAEQRPSGAREIDVDALPAESGDPTISTARPARVLTSGSKGATSSAEYIVTEIKRHRRAALLTLLVFLTAATAGAYLYFSAGNKEAINTLAVLPLTNVNAHPDTEYLSDGLTESIINSLSQLPALRVMSRNSVFRYKGREADAQAAGRDLNVQAVLMGQVVQRGEELSISVELVNAVDNTHIWGERYDRKMTDLVTLRNDIARDISRKLRTRLSGVEEQRLTKNNTANVEAYQLYLKGRHHFFKRTPPEIRKAIGFYQQAIDADPTYALAYTGLADAYRTLPILSYVSSKEGFPQAKAAAKRALEIDGNLAEAHVVLGWVGFNFDWDWRAAESELKTAIELSPNNSEAHLAYAHLLSIVGRHAEAIAEAKLARELDPLLPLNHALEGQFLFYAGRYDEAIARLQSTLQIDPNFWIAQNILGRVYIQRGMFPEAIAALSKARALSFDSIEPNTQLGYALAKSGEREQARAILEKLNSMAAGNYVPAYSLAMIYNGLGERDKALEYLEKSVQEREVQVTFIKIDNRWDDLRADPRFQNVMRRVGLPQ